MQLKLYSVNVAGEVSRASLICNMVKNASNTVGLIYDFEKMDVAKYLKDCDAEGVKADWDGKTILLTKNDGFINVTKEKLGVQNNDSERASIFNITTQTNFKLKVIGIHGLEKM